MALKYNIELIARLKRVIALMISPITCFKRAIVFDMTYFSNAQQFVYFHLPTSRFKLLTPNLFILTTLYFILTTFNSTAQLPCLQTAQESYQNLTNQFTQAEQNNQPIEFTYNTTTTAIYNGERTQNSLEVTIHQKGQTLMILSAAMEYYQDAKDAFIVIPEDKQVIRVDRDKSKQNKVFQLQDSLMYYLEEQNCKTVDGSKTVIASVSNEYMRNKYKVDQVTFFIDQSAGRLTQIQQKMLPNDKKITLIDMELGELKLNAQKQFPKSVVNKFINSKNELQAPYQQYELVDSRINKL